MNTTLWPLEPHTLGKHRTLKAYLDAWLPIVGSWAGQILFIDGFAGPGEYAGGEPGSPLIAMDALIAHNAKHVIRAEVLFLFVESDSARATHLEKLVEARRPKLPRKCRAQVIRGTFENVMDGVLAPLERDQKGLVPSFLMIDPFGISGAPMKIVERLLRHRSSEVYVSFMYEWINRFLSTAEFAAHLDVLFGCQDWRDALKINDPDDRKKFIYQVYDRQLRSAGATNVLRLEVYREGRLVYALFFGTKSLKGCDRMKQAIWKIAPTGDFQFKGTRSDQLVLNFSPDFEPLRDLIVGEFKSKGWIQVEMIDDFVASDRTEYHTSQYKSNVLMKLEEEGAIEVDPTSRKRKKSYPVGTRLRLV